MMNKRDLIRYCLLLVILPSTTSLCAVFSDKTFLARRPDSMMMFLEQPLFLSLQLQASKNNGSIMTVTPSYTFAPQEERISNYFMFNNASKLQVGSNTDIDSRHLKLNENSPTNLSGIISLSPSVEYVGLRFDYAQYLDRFLPNTTLYISVPFAAVQMNPHFDVQGNPSTVDNKTIADYFRGDVMWQVDQSDGSKIVLQGPLSFAKIDGVRSQSGVSNIDIGVEYLFFNNEKLGLAGRFELFVPTSNTARGEYLFEPLLGTAGHWGLGLSANLSYEPFSNFVIFSDIRWRYLFPEVERRTVGLKNKPWSQYMLVGKVDFPYVEPAANILTPLLKVSPGNIFEGLLYFSYSQDNIFLEAGYNLFAKQREKVKRQSLFSDTSYALVSSDFASNFYSVEDASIRTNPFTLAYSNTASTIGMMNGADSDHQGYITASQIDEKRAETPGYITNGVFACLGYREDHESYSPMVGIGVGVEFPNSNASLYQATFWLKAGCIF